MKLAIAKSQEYMLSSSIRLGNHYEVLETWFSRGSFKLEKTNDAFMIS